MLRWSRPQPALTSRTDAREEAQESARKEAAAELRTDILDCVDAAWRGGCPLNRESVKAAIPRKRTEVSSCIETLVAERWLIEVPVPSKLRTHPKRHGFLVRLSPDEHAAVTLEDADVPAEKLVIPPSWRKPEPCVPESQGAAGTDAASEGVPDHG